MVLGTYRALSCNVFNKAQEFITHNLLSQIHDGQTHVGEYCQNLFKGLPIGICWGKLSDDQKNTIILGCNQFEADLLVLSQFFQ